MSTRAQKTLLACAIGLGAVTWWLVAALDGRREAWDSELYFVAVLPGLALFAAVLGWLVPERPWRWAVAPFGGQALAAFVQNPTAGLLPLGLIVFAIFGSFCLPPAYAGAWARRWSRSSGSMPQARSGD